MESLSLDIIEREIRHLSRTIRFAEEELEQWIADAEDAGVDDRTIDRWCEI